ncbi:MAG TPA: hypothetical protein VGH24_10375 [Solirubrobacteraceae bacterium]|jgi:hypothetical protein
MALQPDASGLHSELGAPPPQGLVALLSTEELHVLATSLGDAKRRQSVALDRAIQDALGHVPFILRGTVELIIT